jgi:hypothetical protein
MNLPVVPVPVHAESVRIGIKLAVLAIKGTIPDAAIVQHMVDLGKDQVEMLEFPFETISHAAMQRKQRRREYAFKAMEVLLHRAGEPALLTKSELESIISKCWTVAALMESEYDAASLIDTVGTGKKS